MERYAWVLGLTQYGLKESHSLLLPKEQPIMVTLHLQIIQTLPVYCGES